MGRIVSANSFRPANGDTASWKRPLHAAERDMPESLIRRRELLASIAKVEPEHPAFLERFRSSPALAGIEQGGHFLEEDAT